MVSYKKKTIKKLKKTRGKSMSKRNQKMTKCVRGGDEGDVAEVVYFDGTNYNGLRSYVTQSVPIATTVITADKVKNVYSSEHISNDELKTLCKATERNLLQKFSPPGPSGYYGPRTFGSKIRAKTMAQYIDSNPGEFDEVTPETGKCYLVYYGPFVK